MGNFFGHFKFILMCISFSRNERKGFAMVVAGAFTISCFNLLQKC